MWEISIFSFLCKFSIELQHFIKILQINACSIFFNIKTILFNFRLVDSSLSRGHQIVAILYYICE